MIWYDWYDHWLGVKQHQLYTSSPVFNVIIIYLSIITIFVPKDLFCSSHQLWAPKLGSLALVELKTKSFTETQSTGLQTFLYLANQSTTTEYLLNILYCWSISILKQGPNPLYTRCVLNKSVTLGVVGLLTTKSITHTLKVFYSSLSNQITCKVIHYSWAKIYLFWAGQCNNRSKTVHSRDHLT